MKAVKLYEKRYYKKTRVVDCVRSFIGCTRVTSFYYYTISTNQNRQMEDQVNETKSADIATLSITWYKKFQVVLTITRYQM